MAVCIPEKSKNISDFDPRSIGRCVLWLDSSDRNTLFTNAAGTTPVSSGTQVVAHWKDKSASQANVTSASAGPSYTFSSQFGGLTFASTKTLTGTPPTFSSGGISTFVVFNPTTPFTRTRMFRIFSGTYLASMDTTAIDIMNPSIYNYQLNLRSVSSVNNLYSAITYSTTQNEFNINFGTSSTNWEYSASSYTGTVLEVGATTFTGTVSEIIVFDTFLTIQDKRTIEGYLASKWAVANQTFVPTTVPSCLVWYDADDPARFTGGTTWLDKSGQNNHGINGTAGVTTMPTVTTWSNGRTAARFQAPSKNSMKTTNTITNFVSYFVVARFTKAVGYGFILINNLDGQRQIVVNSTSFPMDLFWAPGGTAMNTGGFIRDQGFLFGGTVTSGSGVAYINGTQVGTNNNPSFSGSSQNYIGSGNGDGGYLTFDLAELLIYSGVVSLANRQSIERYLMQKWGLFFQTPPTHPFFYTRPYLRSFQPIDIPGCQLWLDAADSSSITGTTSVTEWRDKSGNARHLGVGSGTTSYSLNAIKLNSSYMFVTSPVDLSRVTVFLVSKTNPIWNQPVFVIRPNTSVSYGSTDGLQISFYDNSYINVFTQTLTQYANPGTINTTLLSAQASDRLMTTWLNGANETSATNSSTRTSTAQGFAIGAEWANGSYVNIIAIASIYEVIVYNTVLTTSQRQRIEGYLSQKWGIQSSLPSTQPFKQIPASSILPFLPTSVSDCALWFDAADTSTITGTSQVTAWRNKGSISVTATNRVGSCSSGNILSNGLNFIRCPAGTDLGFTCALTSQARTWFIVARNLTQLNATFANAWGPINQTTAGGQDATVFYRQSASLYRAYIGAGGISVNLEGNFDSNPLNQVNLYCFVNSTNSALNTMTLNGTTLSLNVNLAAASYKTTSVLYTINTTGYNTGGDYFEILFYTRALSSQERQHVEAYLTEKWGLKLSLPSTHLFKTIPPSQNGEIILRSPALTVPAVLATARSYLPLSSNSTDIGVAPVAVTVNGTVTYATIGGRQCATFNNSTANFLSLAYTNTTNFTICFWFRPIDGNYYTMFSLTNASLSPAIQVDTISSTTIRAFLALPTNTPWTNSPIAYHSGPGLWYHVAITVNQSTFASQIYFMGGLVGSVTGSGTGMASRNLFFIGKAGDNARGFNGYISQFLFFNSILSGDDIYRVYYST
jgi:hypothetical protein